jgi:hypothetical protein
MSFNTRTVAAIAFTFASAGYAFADSNHHGDQSDDGTLTPSDLESGMVSPMGGAGMMDPTQMEIHHVMMQAMMQMHANMGSNAMMGNASVEQIMPFPMVGPMMMGEFDADGDRLISNEEAHGKLQSMHGQADVDSDGLLTFDEFAPMYAMVMREMMVDQFQVLDADGDGAITEGEMTAPADMIANMPDGEMPMSDD